MLRLLKGEATPVKTEAAGAQIEFEVKTITTAEQARLLDLAQRSGDGIEAMHRYMAEVLRVCVQGLRVGGQAIDAAELAERADLSHRDTLAVVQAIVAEAEKVVFAGAEHEGKSGSPHEHS